MCAYSLKQADLPSLLSRCPYVRNSAETPGCVRALGATAPAQQDSAAIFLLGLNHHTAEVRLRERFFTGTLERMLHELQGLGLSEAAVLFTCSRVEIYGVPGTAGAASVRGHLAERGQVSPDELESHLYQAEEDEAARHLMRIASGLESLVLGEPQILGQVTQALERSRAAGTAGAGVNRLFEAALHAGKRARSETAISRHTLSISHAAVLLALAERPELSRLRVLVIGAGRMAGLAVRALRANGVENIDLVNRSPARSSELMPEAVAVPLSHLREKLAVADVIVTATAAPAPIVHEADFPGDGRRRMVIDLGMPRNVAAGVGSLQGVRVYEIDDLEQVVEQHRIQRLGEVAKVERIVEEELEAWRRNQRGQQLAPVISALRGKVEAVIAAEMDQVLRRMPELDEQTRTALWLMQQRIARKLLHAPTVALKNRDSDEFASVVRDLVELHLPAAAEALPKAPEPGSVKELGDE